MSNPYDPPPQLPPTFKTQSAGDATGGLIPYKNGPALTAYYLSIASLLCCPLGIVAVVLGVLGLQKRAREPAVKGSVHAWIGIVLGTLTTVGMVAILLVAVMSAVFSPKR